MNQEKEIEKQGCPICLKGLVPDLESVIFNTKDWDDHTYKFDCDCREEYKNLRVSIG